MLIEEIVYVGPLEGGGKTKNKSSSAQVFSERQFLGEVCVELGMLCTERDRVQVAISSTVTGLLEANPNASSVGDPETMASRLKRSTLYQVLA